MGFLFSKPGDQGTPPQNLPTHSERLRRWNSSKTNLWWLGCFYVWQILAAAIVSFIMTLGVFFYPVWAETPHPIIAITCIVSPLLLVYFTMHLVPYEYPISQTSRLYFFWTVSFIILHIVFLLVVGIIFIIFDVISCGVLFCTPSTILWVLYYAFAFVWFVDIMLDIIALFILNRMGHTTYYNKCTTPVRVAVFEETDIYEGRASFVESTISCARSSKKKKRKRRRKKK